MLTEIQRYELWRKHQTVIEKMATPLELFGEAFELGVVTAETGAVADNFFKAAERLSERFPFLYVEVARTYPTGWMAWICSHNKLSTPDNKVLISQQGSTYAEACKNGLEALELMFGGCDAEQK
jgi:hypothetical protein